jgi:hypothetical protein
VLYFNVGLLFQHLREGTEKNNEKLQLRLADISDEIGTGYTSNATGLLAATPTYNTALKPR